jgi:hypothetical protein
VPALPKEAKQELINRYLKTCEGRRKLADAFIPPMELRIQHREYEVKESQKEIEDGFRQSLRLIGLMTVLGETPPPKLLENLKALFNATYDGPRPNMWDLLIEEGEED